MSTQSLRTNGDDGSDREQLTIGDCEVCDTTSKYSVGALLSSAANATSSKISRASINLRSLLSGSATKKTNDDDVSTSESDIAISSSVRQKFDNVWFSFVYGRWRISRSKYKKKAPLWLLGEFYFTSRPDEDDEVVFRAFAIDYYSRIWLTYRTELSPLPGSSKTTDCGWGCTLRTCQMMLAQALVVLHLGREWRFWGDEEANRYRCGFGHYDIVSLFGDHLDADLGLYRLMKIAKERNEHDAVGNWYSACTAFGLIRDALLSSKSPLLRCLRMYCVTDGMLIQSEVAQLSEQFRVPVLIVVYVQLGCHTISDCYRKHLISFLSLRNTVGIIGGRPRRSLYFIGSYDNKSLIFLDPHIAHAAIPPSSLQASWQAFHCADFSKMPLDEIDPGCALGFLVLSKNDYESTIKDLSLSQVIDSECEGEVNRVSNPLFVAYAKRPVLSNTVTARPLESGLASHAMQLGFELI
uniref:Cysteine protease n=2 Tax=Ascaris TaxID=6251 RepID=A0A0M3I7Z1_ASCLU